MKRFTREQIVGVVAEKTRARARVVAMRGTERRCRGWKQETILRLLENNLENGERPEDLVVYMSPNPAPRGIGRPSTASSRC
jgi:urocanate hydratase